MDVFFFFFYDEDIDATVQASIDDTDIPQNELEFFYDDKVRKVWHKQEEEWFFSIVDVCQVLTDSTDGRKYWNKLKQRLSDEGFELVTKCHQLKLKSHKDGKSYKTDVANQAQLLRLIQSIPSKKAEPFKQWLARVGAERLDEMADPEKAMDRAVNYYRQKGYSDAWITQRLHGIEIRKELTDEWHRSGIEGRGYAELTNILTHAWSGKSVQEYKQLKNLKKDNLRDNMTNTDLALNLLAEVSTTELSRNLNPKGFSQSKDISNTGGSIAGNARKELEAKLGHSVLSSSNASTPEKLDTK